jgi:hypothetical protein
LKRVDEAIGLGVSDQNIDIGLCKNKEESG